jgi:hypothetical protein
MPSAKIRPYQNRMLEALGFKWVNFQVSTGWMR